MRTRGDEIFDYVAVGGGFGSIAGGVFAYATLKVATAMFAPALQDAGATVLAPAGYFTGWGMGIAAGFAYGIYATAPTAEPEKAESEKVEATGEPTIVPVAARAAETSVTEVSAPVAVVERPAVSLTASGANLFPAKARKSEEQRKNEFLQFSVVSKKKVAL